MPLGPKWCVLGILLLSNAISKMTLGRAELNINHRLPIICYSCWYRLITRKDGTRLLIFSTHRWLAYLVAHLFITSSITVVICVALSVMMDWFLSGIQAKSQAMV